MMDSNSRNKNSCYLFSQSQRIMDTEFTEEGSAKGMGIPSPSKIQFPLFSHMGLMGALCFCYSSQLCDYEILSCLLIFSLSLQRMTRETIAREKLLVEKDGQLEKPCPSPSHCTLWSTHLEAAWDDYCCVVQRHHLTFDFMSEIRLHTFIMTTAGAEHLGKQMALGYSLSSLGNFYCIWNLGKDGGVLFWVTPEVNLKTRIWVQAVIGEMNPRNTDRGGWKWVKEVKTAN